MRFRLTSVPAVLLVLLPFFVAYNGLGLFSTTFCFLVVLAVRQAIVLNDLQK